MSQSITSTKELSWNKHSLLELLRQEKNDVTAAPDVITPRPPSQSAPLSFAQQQIWFLDQLDPCSSHFNLATAVRFKGKLVVAALELSLNEILQRHEVFRTTYDLEEGQPVQIIHEATRQPLPILDLSSGEEGEREETARKIGLEEARRPFDLKQGPALRAKLLRLSEEDHLLLLTIHHICADGWSMGVLYHELITLYGSFRAGGVSPLEELPIQYADYAVWQRRRLQGETLERSLSYWREQLREATVGLELPIDKPRPPVQTYNGAVHPFTLPQGLTQALRAFSRRERVTLFMTMLAAFKALLYRYTRQDDFLVGMPVANRLRPEVMGLIGFFINAFALRTRIDGESSFRSFVGCVRDTTLAAYDHQHLPIEKLMEELQPERRLSHNPLFQVMFNFMLPKPSMSLPGLELSAVEIDNRTARFDIELNLWEVSDELGGSFKYNIDLFEAETIERFANHFQCLLSAAAASPDLPLAALPILSDAERSGFAAGFGAGPQPDPDTECWYRLFERQAARNSSATALTCGDFAMSYGEMDRRSARIGSLLSDLGVGPESVAALLSERKPELVTWFLGVHRAGGAYLPLDPRWPASRLARVLQSSAPAVLVSSSALEPMAREALAMISGSVSLLVMGDEDTLFEGHEIDHGGREAREPRPQAAMENLAYVIYTSGSTGEPKGAMLTHAGLLNHLRAKIEDLALGPSDVVAQTASQCFDISVWQMWAPLLVGGSIRLVPDETAHDPFELLNELGYGGVTVAELVPGVLGAAFDHPEATAALPRLPQLRWLMVTGETLPPELCRRWLGHYPSVALVNAYGPTECSDDITHEVIRVAPGEQIRRIPIGSPVRGIRLYVVDSRGEPAPIGVAGELWAGGAGVGRGYLGQPDLTAERFVPDLFSGEAGGRLYRTGDLTQWLPDGRLEFLGRIDQQVKVRGFRIEPGEVEAALRRHDAISDAAAVAVEGRGGARLVAYIVGRSPNAAPDAAGLREWLGKQLPDYMAPAAFVALDALPLTPNGKLDRRALPEPEPETDVRRGSISPRTPAEDIVAGIWAEVLGLEGIGTEDNFFELGGHSLLATQVMARVRRAFGVELPLRAIFESPTVTGLTRKVEAACNTGVEAGTPPPLAPEPGRGTEVPLSFAQQRLWFLAQFEGASEAYQMAGGLRLVGYLDRTALRLTLNRIVARHEVLRTTFSQIDGRPVQVIGPAEDGFDLQEYDLRHDASAQAELQRLAVADAARPFDLEHGPLIRGRLAQMADDDHVLWLNIHHIIWDGWSMSILVNEFSSLYQSYLRGETDSLPSLSVQYADYAIWQRRWLNGEVWQRQAEYWQNVLAGAPALLELPTDRPRPARQNYAGDAVEVELDADLTRDLKALARLHGATLNMAVLASWGVLLARLAGQTEVVIGVPTANRTRTEIEPLIGFFVNALAMRLDLSGSPSVSEFLARVKARTLDAQQYQDIPFEQVVEIVQPPRSLAHAPVFQTSFSWQNTPEGALDLPGLVITPLATPQVMAKFDLSLLLQEIGPRIAGTLEYSSSLFDRATVQRYLEHWGTVIEAMVADDTQAVDRLPLLGEAARRQILVAWNATEAEYPPGLCAHELFEIQAAQTPDAAALLHEDEQLTYATLNARANQLAHHLRQLGVGPDVRVAICLERGVEMLVALLATLKAGGVYVPLDSSYPPERLAYLLEDSSPAVLLTHNATETVLAGHLPGVFAINLDTDAPWWANQNTRNPDRDHTGLNSQCLAYIIYTSGSTGLPKGVMIEHQGLCNLAFDQIHSLDIGPGSHVLQFASFSFDASVFLLTMALCSGAQLALPPSGAMLAGEALVQTVHRYGISHLGLPPAAIATVPKDAALESVRLLILGGEAVTSEMVQRWAPGRRLINAYGPTEITVSATHHDCSGDEPGDPPIGRPISNIRVYILDLNHQPAPIGVTGELYVGGVGVARGYLSRPELTAGIFLPDPFSGESGARMYRTGDLARWSPDGRIEFLGRNDFQVKIRGYRLELGEIEAALASHSEVREVAVLAREDGEAGKRLVAYYIGRELGAEALRAHLSSSLPEYMLPSAYVRLESWPLTPNGKIDRRALPAPGSGRVGTAQQAVRPRTPAEEVVANLWAEVLGVEEVGGQENFFELGGHSLLATRVISRVREAFGVEMPLRVLFESPTVAEFANAIELEVTAESGLEIGPPAPVSRDQITPVSISQQDLLKREQINPGTSVNNVPILLRQRGEVDLAALEWSFGEIIRRHESLRTTFETVGGVTRQIIHPPAPPPIQFVNLTEVPRAKREEEARRLADEEGQRPFDLARGPLLRILALQLSADEYWLLLVLHHIVIDLWSLSLLISELTALQAARSQGRPAPLPELPVQFADYAVWQRKWLQGAALEKLQAYWRERLGGRLPALRLPQQATAQRPAEGMQSARCPFQLPRALSQQIKAFSQSEGVTLFISLLAAFKAMLYLYTSQTDIIITSPMANRRHLEVESLIGFFANSIPLRTVLDKDHSFRQLLRNVRETALGAYMHQALPLGKIVEILSDENDLSEDLFGRASFALLTIPLAEQETDGLMPHLIETEVGAVSTDLTLSLWVTAEGFKGQFVYKADLFDRELVMDMARRFQRLLEKAVSEPDRKLSDFRKPRKKWKHY
jgi:amino acid adenylation domain-containing protein